MSQPSWMRQFGSSARGRSCVEPKRNSGEDRHSVLVMTQSTRRRLYSRHLRCHALQRTDLVQDGWRAPFFLCLCYEVSRGIVFLGCPYVPFSWSRYLKNWLMDSCYVTCRAYELISFWGHEVTGLIMYAKIHVACDHIIIRTDRQITMKLRTCMFLAEAVNWLDFEVKFVGLIMYAKIACDHIIIRTERQITMKLRTCMFLAEAVNWLDFEVKFVGLIMYAKIACDHIIIRTDRQITMNFRTCMFLAEAVNWLDFEVKCVGLIMYAKIACDHIIIRTDYHEFQDMYVPCWGSELIRFWGQVHGAHYVCKNSLWSHYH